MSTKLVLSVLMLVGFAMLSTACSAGREAAVAKSIRVYSVADRGYVMTDMVIKSEEEWKKLLTEEQFYVAREKGTEKPYKNEYWDNHAKGIYKCVACGLDLYSSEAKYESGTGWPSFWEPVAKENVTLRDDDTLFTRRTEVLCARCGSHLGHVFEDGPEPTGLRYCMNSAAMKFVPAK